MNHPGTPITWEEIEEYGLEECPAGYEPSNDEEQPQPDESEHEARKDKRPS